MAAEPKQPRQRRKGEQTPASIRSQRIALIAFAAQLEAIVHQMESNGIESVAFDGYAVFDRGRADIEKYLGDLSRPVSMAITRKMIEQQERGAGNAE